MRNLNLPLIKYLKNVVHFSLWCMVTKILTKLLSMGVGCITHEPHNAWASRPRSWVKLGALFNYNFAPRGSQRMDRLFTPGRHLRPAPPRGRPPSNPPPLPPILKKTPRPAPPPSPHRAVTFLLPATTSCAPPLKLPAHFSDFILGWNLGGTYIMVAFWFHVFPCTLWLNLFSSVVKNLICIFYVSHLVILLIVMYVVCRTEFIYWIVSSNKDQPSHVFSIISIYYYILLYYYYYCPLNFYSINRRRGEIISRGMWASFVYKAESLPED